MWFSLALARDLSRNTSIAAAIGEALSSSSLSLAIATGGDSGTATLAGAAGATTAAGEVADGSRISGTQIEAEQWAQGNVFPESSLDTHVPKPQLGQETRTSPVMADACRSHRGFRRGAK
jgi:hypothetical protein